MIPQELASLFWDIRLDQFDPKVYPDYTIFRVLEYGNRDAFLWLRATFAESEIRRVLCTERRLSRRSANFWALIYGIPLEQVAALQAE
jgi:hypothetical protein